MKEYNFKVSNIIDKNNEYHMLIISFAAAFNDIALINKEIFEIYENDKDKKEYIWFLSKTMIGHLREAYKFLYNSLEDSGEFKGKFKDKLFSINGVINLYNKIKSEIGDNTNGTFLKEVLMPSRDFVFHYNSKSWFDLINDVLEEFKTENSYSSIKLFSENPKNAYEMIKNDYVFASDIQLNCILKLGQMHNDKLKEKEFINKLLDITVVILQILELILNDFINNISPTKYYTITSLIKYYNNITFDKNSF